LTALAEWSRPYKVERARAAPAKDSDLTAEGEVRWMEIRDWLKVASDNGTKAVRQIVFSGERLDVMSA
jgi:hypothetical protein